MKFAIVVVAFNRPNSLSRLLDSVSRADFRNIGNVDLIVSIDFGGPKEVSEIAENYQWDYGVKRVVLHQSNLGLRSHVLLCGDMSLQYDFIIMLEDDLIVAPSFVKFSIEAFAQYHNDERIGGISLYNHKLNVYTLEPFAAIYEGADVYFLQMASSWGQVFFRSEWIKFREWLARNASIDNFNIPAGMKKWPNSSWLKFYCAYLVDQGKFFVYPHQSLSSNFGDKGTHVSLKDPSFQVEICPVAVSNFKFYSIDESKSVYDIFFESIYLKLKFEKEFSAKVQVNFYGHKKQQNEDYVLSSQLLPFKKIRSYDLALRPYENNIIFGVKGDAINLYAINTGCSVSFVDQVRLSLYRSLYLYRIMKKENIINLLLLKILRKLC